MALNGVGIILVNGLSFPIGRITAHIRALLSQEQGNIQLIWGSDMLDDEGASPHDGRRGAAWLDFKEFFLSGDEHCRKQVSYLFLTGCFRQLAIRRRMGHWRDSRQTCLGRV